MWNIILQNALICSTTKSGSCFKLRRLRKPLSIRLLSGLQPDRVFEDNLKPKLDSPLYDEQTFNLLDATDRTRSPLAPGTYIFPFWFYGALAHGNNLDFKAGKLSSFSVTGIRILTPLEPSIEQTESLLKTDCSSLWWVWMCVCVCMRACVYVCVLVHVVNWHREVIMINRTQFVFHLDWSGFEFVRLVDPLHTILNANSPIGVFVIKQIIGNAFAQKSMTRALLHKTTYTSNFTWHSVTYFALKF